MPDTKNMSPEQLQKVAAEMRRKEYEGLTPEEIEERERQKEMRKQKNIRVLGETLDLLREGQYMAAGEVVRIDRTQEELAVAHVFLPDEIRSLPALEAKSAMSTLPCRFSCENRDALSLAREKVEDPSYGEGNPDGRILVLNLASASRPGGAVHEGANGQEEDLCRRSSLLLSLESGAAGCYYEYNRSLNTHLGSDAVIISPDVTVFRDENGELLQEPFCISVMSCSAPMIRLGLEGRSEEEYRDLLLGRIAGMLRCAANLGYGNLVLGAFGCGVFGNDAAVVSDAFRRAFDELPPDCFAHVDFAVLCSPGKEYNYREFRRNFAG